MVGQLQSERNNMELKRKEREKARELRLQGLSLNKISREVGAAKASVSVWVRDIQIPKTEKPKKLNDDKPDPYKQIDWNAVQKYYDDVKSLKECSIHFGISEWNLENAFRDGFLNRRLKILPFERILIENSPLNTGSLKKRLFSSGLKEKRCEGENCGITEWRGKPISFELHHVNGINNDHRLENLLILCPNCHSQTDSYKGRNKVAARKRKFA